MTTRTGRRGRFSKYEPLDGLTLGFSDAPTAQSQWLHTHQVARFNREIDDTEDPLAFALEIFFGQPEPDGGRGRNLREMAIERHCMANASTIAVRKEHEDEWRMFHAIARDDRPGYTNLPA